MKRTDPLRYVILLFLLIGIGFLGGAIYTFISHRNFMESAVKTTGRVINLHSNRKGSKAPVIEFSDANGQAHFYYHNVYTQPSAYDLGETIDLYFNPVNPEDATLGGFSALTAIFGFIGFIFTLISIIFIKVFWNHQTAVTHQKHY
ncbi:DUF3592 domain-containing protein [Emticicia sp. BO119]|uniref:DUF3592 domain-containing protein n=1 Tax=Emticicia sp. BO119 TaxID=2757768 RepID=UPI0015F120D5|nr:DUF3592 domain-containing protein [Emticicia sp. BO119]MBA4853104.1 DUF3592 domain-containing protein [Emticicia sp. BO119]